MCTAMFCIAYCSLYTAEFGLSYLCLEKSAIKGTAFPIAVPLQDHLIHLLLNQNQGLLKRSAGRTRFPQKKDPPIDIHHQLLHHGDAHKDHQQ